MSYAVELKAKAEKASTASANKVQNTRDKYSSRSTKDMKWDPDHRRPIPPVASSQIVQPVYALQDSPPVTQLPPPSLPQRGPPALPRGTRPNMRPSPPSVQESHAQDSPSAKDIDKIDWANLSPEDKAVFFSWLDEFFERLLKIKITPRSVEETVQTVGLPADPPRPVSLLNSHLQRMPN